MYKFYSNNHTLVNDWIDFFFFFLLFCLFFLTLICPKRRSVFLYVAGPVGNDAINIFSLIMIIIRIIRGETICTTLNDFMKTNGLEKRKRGLNCFFSAKEIGFHKKTERQRNVNGIADRQTLTFVFSITINDKKRWWYRIELDPNELSNKRNKRVNRNITSN